jgi:glycerophosphoryl diester phosphodiesterase
MFAGTASSDALSCLFDKTCNKPVVIGHQGAPGFWVPRNSMASFQNAEALGANGVEADVRFSADGVPFVCHDESIRPWTAPGCWGRVPGATNAQDLAKCRLFPSWSEFLVPLEDLVRQAKGRMLIQLDVKEPGKLRPLAEAVRRWNARAYCFFSMTVWDAVQNKKALDQMPDIRLALEVRTVKQIDDVLSWMRLPQLFMVETNGEFLDHPLTDATLRERIKQLHEAGLKVEAVGDTRLPSADSQLKLLQDGYDAVLSYDVEKSVEALRSFEPGHPAISK